MVSGWASSCLRYDKKFEQDTTPAVAIAHGESMARAKSRAKFLVLTSYFNVGLRLYSMMPHLQGV